MKFRVPKILMISNDVIIKKIGVLKMIINEIINKYKMKINNIIKL